MKKILLIILLINTFIWGAVDRQGVNSFVTRFYQTILNRTPDIGGFNTWTNALISGNYPATSIAEGFIFSNEFIQRHTNNSQYITILYQAFFDRSPDNGGYSYWLNYLNQGHSRANVLYGFLYSQEFKNLTIRYGIRATPESPYIQQTNTLIPIIKSSCNANASIKYFYYETPSEANIHFNNALSQINPNKTKPFWDIRYGNPVSKYISNTNADWYPNHSIYTGLDARYGEENTLIGTYASQLDSSGNVVQSKCIDGALAGGTTINLYDSPEQYIQYGGVASTFTYVFEELSVRPWKTNHTGNYVLQAQFSNPFWKQWNSNNHGGEVNFVFYLKNIYTNKRYSYVITVYAFGQGTTSENAIVPTDGSNSIPFVSTAINEETNYVTKSIYSATTSNNRTSTTFNHTKGTDWEDFYRINITYDNFKNALSTMSTFTNTDKEPANWEVTNSMIQYELEEDGGKATLSGSFWDFQTFITNSAI